MAVISGSYAQHFRVPPWRSRLARMAEGCLDKFSVQELASTAWAFATVGHQDKQLFQVLARIAERRLDKFNAQDLGNTGWAFATVDQQDEQLFQALARMAERHLEKFSA